MAELTGKAISELPAATTIGDSDLLALSQNGASKKVTPPVLLSVVESEISGLNSSIATYVRPNLLDNWYFAGGGSQRGYGVFPINQRGQASYTNGWVIDRWQIPSTINMTLSLSGVTITNTNATTRYSALQPLKSPNTLRGKTVTGSILLANGALYFGTATIPAEVPSSNNNISIAQVGNYAELRIENRTDGVMKMSITMSATQSVMIQAIKLELGSTQTLAHQENGSWVLNEIPDYGEQLAKCQRYLFTPAERNAVYQVYGIGPASSDSNAVITITVPKPMARIVNFATNIDTSKLKLNNTIPITNIEISNISGVTAKANVTCATGALTLGNCYFLTNAANVNPTFLISAE